MAKLRGERMVGVMGGNQCIRKAQEYYNEFNLKGGHCSR